MQTPEGKHFFGMVKVGEKGQIVIPRDARRIFNIKPGDSLLVLGDESQGIAIVRSDSFLEFTDALLKAKETVYEEEGEEQ